MTTLEARPRTTSPVEYLSRRKPLHTKRKPAALPALTLSLDEKIPPTPSDLRFPPTSHNQTWNTWNEVTGKQCDLKDGWPGIDMGGSGWSLQATLSNSAKHSYIFFYVHPYYGTVYGGTYGWGLRPSLAGNSFEEQPWFSRMHKLLRVGICEVPSAFIHHTLNFLPTSGFGI